MLKITLPTFYMSSASLQAPKENIVLFSGDDVTRIKQSLSSWTKEFERKYGDASISSIDVEMLMKQDEGLGSLAAELFTPSLFSTKRLILIKGFPFSVQKKVTEPQEANEAQLLRLLEQVPPDVVVLLQATKPDKRRASYKRLVKFVRLKEFSLEDIDVRAQVTMELAGMVSPADSGFLISILGGRKEYIANDMQILRQYGLTQPLTRDVIELLCPPKLQDSIFLILDYVLAGKKKEAITRLKRLLQMGEEPLKILGAFAWQMEMLTIAKYADQSRMDYDSAAKILGMKPYSISKVGRIVKGLSSKDIAAMVARLAKIDRLVKSGGLIVDKEGTDVAAALSEWIMLVPEATFA